MAIWAAAASLGGCGGIGAGIVLDLARWARLLADFLQRRGREVDGPAPSTEPPARGVDGVAAGCVDLGRAAAGEHANVGVASR